MMVVEHINSIVTFIVISLGLGYGVLWASKAKPDGHFLIRLLEVFAVGLATFAFLGVLLDLLHIPLRIHVYLLIALIASAVPLVINIVRKRDDPVLGTVTRDQLLSETTWCVLALAIIMGAFFNVYYAGANAYPYLEDDDPWNHALGATYVATQHTYSVPAELRADPVVAHGFAQYLEPYPPTYDVIMGVLRQTNDSITWTLKFFNVVLITVGLAFFYLLLRAYMPGSHNDLKALFATFILAALPGFMSHFIWNQTLAIILIPVALYSTLRAMDDRSWYIAAMVTTASAFVTQPVVSAVFGVTLVMLFVIVLVHEIARGRTDADTGSSEARDADENGASSTSASSVSTGSGKTAKRSRTTKGTAPQKPGWLLSRAPLLRKLVDRFPKTTAVAAAGIGGGLLSLLFWGTQMVKWGIGGIAGIQGGAIQTAASSEYTIQSYRLMEVIFPPFSSRIDQATGLGLAVSITLAIAIIAIAGTAKKSLAPRRDWRGLHALAWLAFTMYLVFAPSFGLPSFWTSRAWPLMAIPLAIVATMGAFIVINSLASRLSARIAMAVILAVLIGLTSIPAKVAVQTAQWPPGAHWTAPSEVGGYLQMQQALPKNTRVYPVCGGDSRAVGFDMQSEQWDTDILSMRKRGLNVTAQEFVAFLEQKRFAYTTMDATCVRDNGENATTQFVADIGATGRFQQVASGPGFLLMRFV